jgi:hypothetical protein
MFDSLRYAKQLEDAGFTRNQAETQIQIMTEIIYTTLATKQDLRDVRTELKSEIRESEYRLTIKLGTIVSIAIGAAVAIAKLI